MIIGNSNRATNWLLVLGTAAIAVASSREAAASCGKAPTTWPRPPRVVLHLSEMQGPTGWDAFGTQLQLLSQANDAVKQFNAIGATSAAVTGVETTFDPFTYSGSYNDPAPTIHVGFQPADLVRNKKGEKVGGFTSPLYLSDNCSPTVTIEFPDLNKAWSFSSPFALAGDGARYYDAGLKAPSADGGGEWFRTSFLHELMHGFGLSHTSSEYAMMNHRGASDADNGGFPWANRPDADAVRPLPDDVKRLRASYPAAGSRWEVAVLNTWFHVTPESEGSAADQVKLCTPSLGTKFTSDTTTSGACGAGGDDAGSTHISEGDMLRTRFALANYSTGSVHVTSKLWLSADEQLDESDTPANSWDIRDISAATSDLAEVAFKMPSLPPGQYHPIVVIGSQHVNSDGTIDPHSPTTDWIPLRGTVTVCAGLCPTAPTWTGTPQQP